MRGSLNASAWAGAALVGLATLALSCGGAPFASPAAPAQAPQASLPSPPPAAVGTTVTSSADALADGSPDPATGGEAPELPTSSGDEHSDPTPGEGPAASGGTLDRGALAPASKYASLDRSACEAELTARHVPFERVGEARGVLAPLRLTGPIAGVTFRSPLPASKRRTSLMEIYDCRLVLALDDFAHLLARHGIVEVVHLSVYRPVPAKSLKTGALGRRHGGALAIDAAIFKNKDGQTLSVEKDFHGRIGARPCPAPANATELRKIACEANDARLFNVLLTPDYNWAHRNHFHLEVTAGVRWTLVR